VTTIASAAAESVNVSLYWRLEDITFEAQVLPVLFHEKLSLSRLPAATDYKAGVALVDTHKNSGMYFVLSAKFLVSVSVSKFAVSERAGFVTLE